MLVLMMMETNFLFTHLKVVEEEKSFGKKILTL
jgi:hypothetical protein